MDQKRILVVEDNEDSSEVISILVAVLDYDVVAVATRDDAVRMLEQSNIDLVLMDFQMPGKSLAEFLEDAKRLSPQTMLILYSAVNCGRIARKHGIKHWLNKPFEVEELKKLLEQVFAAVVLGLTVCN